MLIFQRSHKTACCPFLVEDMTPFNMLAGLMLYCLLSETWSNTRLWRSLLGEIKFSSCNGEFKPAFRVSVKGFLVIVCKG